MSSRLPKLVAFDLDYTLWDLWIDTHVTGPLHRPEETTLNEVLDRHDEPVRFYKDVGQILHRLRAADVTIAACSRTTAPSLARQALQLLLVPPKPGDDTPTPAIAFFDQQEIYPGSKIIHFEKLHEKTGIPYSEMLFYDDEYRNMEVERLGVTMCLVTEGVNDKSFEKGLAQWRKRHPHELADGQ